ncbi:MAG TPA: hypothetical protein VKU01_03935 [Bryobacteraceae bacterium]|nr:hypothetical protein [Bryobacteraceae bacterium]
MVIAVNAANPSSGTLTDSTPTLNYTAGPFLVPNVTDNVSGTPVCDSTIPVEQCDTFTLNVNVASSDASKKQIKVTLSFPIAAGEFDLFVYNSAGQVIASDTAGGEPSVAVFPAVSGAYTIVVDPWNPLGQSFSGTIALEPIPPQPPPATGIPPRFQVYPAPPSAGGAASSGEPSISVDWNPNVASLRHDTVNQGGVAFFTANLNQYRVVSMIVPHPQSRYGKTYPAPSRQSQHSTPLVFATTLEAVIRADYFNPS